MRIKYLLFLLVTLCLFQSAVAQNTMLEKRIYLLDVTASMKGKGYVKTDNIFDEVIEKLSNAIGQINSPDCEVTVIPFTNKCHSEISQTINPYILDQSLMNTAKDSLIRAVSDISIQKGDTNIADAWSRGVEEIDSNKINYIFLLTDGLHNTGEAKEVLYERLKAWQEFSKSHYYFAFYVMLTPNAKEGEIVTIIDQTKQMWLIESMDVNASLITTGLNLYANVYENKNVSMFFKSNNQYVLGNDIDIELELSQNPTNEFSVFYREQ